MADEIHFGPGIAKLEEIGKHYATQQELLRDFSVQMEGRLAAIPGCRSGGADPALTGFHYLGVRYDLEHVFERRANPEAYLPKVYFTKTASPRDPSFGLLGGTHAYFNNDGKVLDEKGRDTGLNLLADVERVLGLLATGNWGRPTGK